MGVVSRRMNEEKPTGGRVRTTAGFFVVDGDVRITGGWAMPPLSYRDVIVDQ